MLPSKPLYGNDKKPSSSDNNHIDNNLPPPPPYSEYSSSSNDGSSYGGGYHERTPTAPPVSLLNPAAANENHPYPSSPHYPMPSNPHTTNPNWPTTYGSVDTPSPTRHVPDADGDDYIDNNNTAQQQQQPLLPPTAPHQPSLYKKLSNCYKSNRCVNYIKSHWTIKGVLYTLFFICMLTWIISTDDNDNKHDGVKTPRPSPAPPSDKVTMTSPYPFTPSHYDYANNDTKEMTDLPASTLSTLAIDFTSHTGELHLVPTDDPVSWLSFSSPSSGSDRDAFSLSSEFTLRNSTSLAIVINSRAYSGGRLVAVLHVSPHDRQHAQLIIHVDTMTVYALTQQPENMIQDLDVTLKGAMLGLNLPDGPHGWKGKNLRVKLEGNNNSFGVSRLEASGTIELILTGMAGGDLELQESILAKHIKLSSRNGRIVMTDRATMMADTIDLTTTNSKLAVASIQARKQCTLRTRNGNIDVTLLPPMDGTELDVLDVQSENSGIHIAAKTLIKRASINSDLGSITMHATQHFDGRFDIQSALGRATIEDNEADKTQLDVSGKSIKQGRRGQGTRDHQIKIFSYAGSSHLVFNL